MSVPTSSTMDETEDEVSLNSDPLYALCLADWVKWGTETWRNEQGFDIRKDTLLFLLLGLGSDRSNASDASLSLLRTLASHYPNTAPVVDLMTSDTPRGEWAADDLEVMNQRLGVLEGMKKPVSMDDNDITPQEAQQIPVADSPPLIPGWHRLETGVNWNPCPIGVYYVG